MMFHNHPLVAFIFDLQRLPSFSLPLAKTKEIEVERDIYMGLGQEGKT